MGCMGKRVLIGLGIVLGGVVFLSHRGALTRNPPSIPAPWVEKTKHPSPSHHPLGIQSLRDETYAHGDVVIEQTLANNGIYIKYVASYRSAGNTIYGILTVPIGETPEKGWPAIIFNHGYIPPAEYDNTQKYITYIDAFARNGYVVFMSDYRGHGRSEGMPSGGYGSNAYTIDVLHALVSIQNLSYVDASRIGMWGHSMGGHITLRSMVVRKDIRAGVIWAGVVGSYPDLFTKWRRGTPTPVIPSYIRRWRNNLEEVFGTPKEGDVFWDSISSTAYLDDVSGPLQLHHATGDVSVPVIFSQELAEDMEKHGKQVELFIYEGDDHNISTNFSTAMERSVVFMDEHVK